MSSVSALWQAWRRYARGKGRRPTVARFSIDADKHIMALHRELSSGLWRPGPSRLSLVLDPKPRLIAAPTLRDRVVHEAVVAEIGPSFTCSFIEHSYACRDGRGPERSVLQYLANTRRFPWRMSLDVRRYFPSVRHAVLLDLLGRRVRDEDTRSLLGRLVASASEVYASPLARQVLDLDTDPLPPGCGLPIGSCFSQWAANVYLDSVDHLIQRRLRPGAYQRYMDDLTLFSDSRDRLVEAHEAIAEWLWRERGLYLHRSANPVSEASSPSIYLGYRVSRSGLCPGPKIRRRIRRKVAAAAGRGPETLRRSLFSYRSRVRFG